MIDNAQIEAIARECRVQIIRMLAHAGSGHPGGSLSVIELRGLEKKSRPR